MYQDDDFRTDEWYLPPGYPDYPTPPAEDPVTDIDAIVFYGAQCVRARLIEEEKDDTDWIETIDPQIEVFEWPRGAPPFVYGTFFFNGWDNHVFEPVVILNPQGYFRCMPDTLGRYAGVSIEGHRAFEGDIYYDIEEGEAACLSVARDGRFYLQYEKKSVDLYPKLFLHKPYSLVYIGTDWEFEQQLILSSDIEEAISDAYDQFVAHDSTFDFGALVGGHSEFLTDMTTINYHCHKAVDPNAVRERYLTHFKIIDAREQFENPPDRVKFYDELQEYLQQYGSSGRENSEPAAINHDHLPDPAPDPPTLSFDPADDPEGFILFVVSNCPGGRGAKLLARHNSLSDTVVRRILIGAGVITEDQHGFIPRLLAGESAEQVAEETNKDKRLVQAYTPITLDNYDFELLRRNKKMPSMDILAEFIRTVTDAYHNLGSVEKVSEANGVSEGLVYSVLIAEGVIQQDDYGIYDKFVSGMTAEDIEEGTGLPAEFIDAFRPINKISFLASLLLRYARKWFVDVVTDFYLKCKSERYTAKVCRISGETVHRILIRKGLAPKDQFGIIDLYNKGMTPEEVANQLNRKVRFVRRYLPLEMPDD